MAMEDCLDMVTPPLSLGKEREQWLGRAWGAIDESKLGALNRMMANIPSPTGEERQLAQAIVGILSASGIDGFYQPMDDDQGNAVGRLPGAGGGADSCFTRRWIRHFPITSKKSVRGSAIVCRSI